MQRTRNDTPYPSQVAHDDTPPPRCSHSPGTPSHRESAPVARIRLLKTRHSAHVIAFKTRVTTILR